MNKIKEVLASLTPILIDPKKDSLTLSISKRFFLFRMMQRIINLVEEDPRLNFIALLKNYKVLGKFLDGTVHEFYRDRNKLYFKNFFYDTNLYHIVKKDLEYFHPKYKDVRLTITKRGVLIYHNYKPQGFNVLLVTVHSGTWMPMKIHKNLKIDENSRTREEDIDTHKIYAPLVLEKGGVWIDNKQSRFLVDFNRTRDRAIYTDAGQVFDVQALWQGEVWKKPFTQAEKKEILQSYDEFYFTLAQLIESYQFNIIFDGHSMNPHEGRPSISFGTKFIPKFYMPIVRSMRRKMNSLGYAPVLFDAPYWGGYIVEWCNNKFPNTFIFSMEINKSLYSNKTQLCTYKTKVEKLAKDLQEIFDIEVENESD